MLAKLEKVRAECQAFEPGTLLAYLIPQPLGILRTVAGTNGGAGGEGEGDSADGCTKRRLCGSAIGKRRRRKGDNGDIVGVGLAWVHVTNLRFGKAERGGRHSNNKQRSSFQEKGQVASSRE